MSLKHDTVASTRRMSLLELIEQIVADGDSAALHELHDRREVFRFDGGQGRLVEFVQWLGERPWMASICGNDPLACDTAKDLTIDKFSHLPSARGVKQSGADCRLYLGACARFVRSHLRRIGRVGALVEERLTAQALQAMVERHFERSALEARRRSRCTTRRYTYRLDGRSLCLWFPKIMAPVECRRIIRELIDSEDSSRADLQSVLQERINNRVRTPVITSLQQAAGSNVVGPDDASIWSLEHEISVHGLAEVVAREKCSNIHQLRPSIRAMGPVRLEGMIRRIFEDLATGFYRETEIARDFGVHKVTFSRFAGSRWRLKRATSTRVVPDLFRNAAAVIAAHPAFVEAAQASGVLSSVTKTINP